MESCYGSEIKTPPMDALAREGLRFAQFYNTGRCCPTRATLPTGLYPHQAGVGHMNTDEGLKSPREKGIPAWDTLSEEEKDKQDLRMC